MTPDDKKWIERIDKLKEIFELLSDTEAAEYIGITQQALSQVRLGATNLGPIPKLIILDRLGLDDLRLAIYEVIPEKKRRKLRDCHNKVASRNLDLFDK